MRTPSDRPLSLAGIHVLVVAEAAERAELVRHALEYWGALVTPSVSVAGAVRVLERMRADAVVVDLESPEDDRSFWLIRKLRALPPEQGGTTPAIALTPAGADRERLRGEGFQAHLERPVHAAELARVIADLVAARRGEGRAGG